MASTASTSTSSTASTPRTCRAHCTSSRPRRPRPHRCDGPQTIDYQATSMGYYQLTLAIKDILTIVNTQYYNSGSMMGCNQQVYSQGTVDFLTSLSCIQLEMGLRPDQVGIGVPAVQAAAAAGTSPSPTSSRPWTASRPGRAAAPTCPRRSTGRSAAS
ncbi:hypothetical protein NKG05_05520 [Oerskovia sp. M15]